MVIWSTKYPKRREKIFCLAKNKKMSLHLKFEHFCRVRPRTKRRDIRELLDELPLLVAFNRSLDRKRKKTTDIVSK